MRICVFGAGAVGSHFAVRLALAGHDVSCVMRGAHLDAVKANGLTLRVGNGEFKAKVRASSDPAALGRQDAVICTLKATGLPSLADGLQPLLGEDTAVVFAQNGVPWWYDIGLSPGHPPVPDLAFLDPGGRLRAAIPKQLIVGGVVFSSNEVVAPAVVANLSPERNRLLIGECDDRASDRVAKLRAALNEASIDSPEVTQIRETIWSKLLTNMSMSVLCLLTGQSASRPSRWNSFRSASSSGLQAVSKVSPTKIEFAPAKKQSACISSVIAERPADRRTYDFGIMMRASATIRTNSMGAIGAAL